MNEIVLFGEHFGSVKNATSPFPILPSIFRIATHLRSQGYKVSTLLMWMSDLDTFTKVIDSNINTNTKIIGITSTLLFDIPVKESDIDDFIKKIEIIKSRSPRAKIVVGGSMVSSYHLYTDNFKRIYPFVDTFITGQGETAIDAVVKNVFNNEKLITTNISPKVCADSTYPFFDFNTSTINYTPLDLINSSDALGIEYSRGCIFKCSFCNYPLIGKTPGSLSKDKQILREEFIRNYNEFGTKFYYFTDSLLNDSVERMEALAEVTTSLPFEVKFAAYIRLDLIHKFPSMASLLKDAGLISSFVGIETINDQSGKSVRKGLGLQRINQALEICNKEWKNSVGITAGFIYGLPHDTNETADQLMEWLDEDLVRDTLTDISVAPLKLVSKEMTENDKFNYTWKGERSRNWTNKNGYTFNQAEIDRDRTLKHFYSHYDLPIKFLGFDVPQIFAYADQAGKLQEVSEFYFKRRPNSYIRSVKEWKTLIGGMFLSRRAEYINQTILRSSV